LRTTLSAISSTHRSSSMRSFASLPNFVDTLQTSARATVSSSLQWSRNSREQRLDEDPLVQRFEELSPKIENEQIGWSLARTVEHSFRFGQPHCQQSSRKVPLPLIMWMADCGRRNSSRGLRAVWSPGLAPHHQSLRQNRSRNTPRTRRCEASRRERLGSQKLDG